MAAANNTIMALWGKSSVPKAKEASSDVISVHSTRSRAADDRSAPEKEATSRLAKPDMERNMPAKDQIALKEPMCHASLQVQGDFSWRLHAHQCPRSCTFFCTVTMTRVPS